MKYLLCVLLMLFTISSVGLCLEGIIFFYDFNNEQTGKPPSDPWKPTGVGTIEVANFPSATNKSVKITDSGSGGGMTLLLDKPITGTVSLEFKFLREKKWTLACEIFYVLNQKCPDDWSGICIKDSDNLKVSYHDGAGWIDTVVLEDEVWQDFKIIFHLDKDKYDFYYNGKKMAENVGYRNWGGLNGKGIDKFNVANVGDGGSTFVKYYDDIILYEGTTRPFAVKSESKLTTVWGSVKLSALQSSVRQYPGGHKGTRFEKGIISHSKFAL
ncbi:MAG: hypothetical protein QG588_891 [Candidatus Poribacteria bacterium]|nr:hypothetical protein [Candidatus Poribacteria bacterium]